MKNIFFLMIVVLLGGCSSIINGTSQQVYFTGNVTGIQIRQDGVLLCSTPCSTLIPREKNGTMLTAEKDGFETETVMLKTKLSNYFWGNIITGGLLGSTTDCLSGGMWEYAPSQFYVELKIDGRADLKRREINLFVLKNYTQLKAESVRENPGEYIVSLSDLTGVSVQTLSALLLGCIDAALCVQKIIITPPNRGISLLSGF